MPEQRNTWDSVKSGFGVWEGAKKVKEQAGSIYDTSSKTSNEGVDNMADTVGSFVDSYTKSSKKDADSYIRRELFKQFDITNGPIKICADISYNTKNSKYGQSGEWVTTLTLPDPAPKKKDETTPHTDVKEYLESFHKNQKKPSTARGGRKTRTGKRRKRGKSRRRGKRR